MQARLIFPILTDLSEDDLFMARFRAVGYQVGRDDKARLYDQCLALWGEDAASLDILREPYFLRLFDHAQIRKATPHRLDQLKAIAQPHDATPRFYDQMAILVDLGVLLRGYDVECPSCEQACWLELGQIKERHHCMACRAVFQLPLDLSFSFKPNAIFAKALRNGALTVFLSVLALQSSQLLAWGAGYTLRHQGKRWDVDMVALRGDELLLIECKDRLSPNWEQSLVKLKQIAAELGTGTQVMLATLDEDWQNLTLSLNEQGIQVMGCDVLLGDA